MNIKLILLAIISIISLSGCINIRVVLFESGGSESQQTQATKKDSKQNVESSPTLQSSLRGYGTSIHTNPNNSMIGTR